MNLNINNDVNFNGIFFRKTKNLNPKKLPELKQDIVKIGDKEKTLESAKPAAELKTEQVALARKVARGVNFDALDKEKTYVGMQYGRRNRIAKQIVRFTKKYCTESDVPAHVFALSHQNGEWYVYESHIMTNKDIGLKKGSHKLKATDWIKLGKNSLAETDIYEAKFDTETLDKNAGQPYGSGDMVKMLLSSIFNKNGKQSDSKGLLCSEYLATGMKDICNFYNLSPWCITPAHFKDYMVQNGIKQVNK